jgi:thymidylate kinase
VTGAAERDAAVELPKALAVALRAIEDTASRWVLLRPRATLAEPHGDVDVLVEPGDLERVRGALVREGFLAMPVPSPDAHLATYDEAAGRFVWIHVQTELRLAGEALPAASVLAAATGEPPQPADAWLLWILLLRALVDKGELAERHRPHVARLAASWAGGPEPLEEIALRRGIDPAAAVKAAAAADWATLMSQSVHVSQPAPSRLRRIARLALALRSPGRLRRRRGLSVALLGPDGAGKTSLIERLRRDLPLPTRVQYMGLTGGSLPRADALRVPGLVLAGRLAILWFRYARSAYHRARGELVLFDRYTLDGAVPSGMRLSLAGRLSRRVQRYACPMPDMVLLLDASGELLHARSAEYDAATLESWMVAYRRLQGSVPGLERIDAERSADEVARQAESLIWQRYRERHGAARGG